MDIKINSLIRSELGCGIVLDIFPHSILKDGLAQVHWVRNIFKSQKPELIPISTLENVRPCTVEDIQAEIKTTQMKIDCALSEFAFVILKSLEQPQ